MIVLWVGVSIGRGVHSAVLAIGAGSTVKSIALFEMEGEWKCLAEI